jgi:hypothetical protein
LDRRLLRWRVDPSGDWFGGRLRLPSHEAFRLCQNGIIPERNPVIASALGPFSSLSILGFASIGSVLS